MMVFGRSTACSMSQMTRYWLIGTSSDVSCGIQSSSHSRLTAAISSATPSLPAAWPFLLPISSIKALITSFASPIAAVSGHPVPVYVGPVAGGVQQDLVVCDLRPPVCPHEAAPDPEDNVRLLQEVQQGLWGRSDGSSQRQRVVLGKAALADHRREHRAPAPSRQAPRDRSSPRAYSTPWPAWMTGSFAFSRDVGDGLDVLRVGRCPVAGYGRVLQLLFELSLPYVERHLQQDGPSLAGAEVVEGRAHQLRYAFDLVDTGPPSS